MKLVPGRRIDPLPDPPPRGRENKGRENASLAAATLLLAALVLVSCVSSTAIAPATPTSQAFPAELVAKGAQLAAVGNCVTCHTAEGGKSFAGGFPLKTPFGTIYGTNITPDPETGIGRWSEADFSRAMREGVDREGHHLFPAFPYDHFTKATDEDIRALYAYVMTREPVRARTPANTVVIPRPFIAIWKAMYFEPGVFRPDPAKDARWNRGAYLAEGLGHCGACHTPRNKLGAEEKRDHYAGGEVDGWHAPALNDASPSPVPWTAEATATYLRTGIAEAHALAAGPMSGVVRNLSRVPDDDVRAMAVYFESLDTRPPALRNEQARKALATAPRGRAASTSRGAVVYAGACADCHDRGRAAEGGAMPLPLAIGLTLPTPGNLIRIVRDGILPKEQEHVAWMPDYAGALTDEQLTDLVVYLRTFTDLPAWKDVAGEVRKAAKEHE
jgi:mono/diheme cytochrome c family protein